MAFPSLNKLTGCFADAAYPLLHPPDPCNVADNASVEDGADSNADEPAEVDTPGEQEATAPPYNPDARTRRTPHGIVTRVLKFDVMLTVALDLAFFVMACVVADRVRTSTNRDGFVVACVALSLVSCIVNLLRAICAVAVILAAGRIRSGWPFWRMYNVYYFWTLTLSLVILAIFGMCIAAISRDPEFKDSMVMLSVMNIVFRALVLLVFFLVPLFYTKWFRRIRTTLLRRSDSPDMFT